MCSLARRLPRDEARMPELNVQETDERMTARAGAAADEVPGLVSVIIPAYNAAEFVVECLESVFAQSYPHWEILVVDDGSKDNTREILDSAVS
jgi:cellulose synthase/poly-beta-1,6-N-acetylglucosamine synthase-like glycosyltransferase